MAELEGSEDLFWHRRFERGLNGRLITHISSFNHSRLSAYKSEATIFGLTEIQDNRFVYFYSVISQYSFVSSLTCLKTLLD